MLGLLDHICERKAPVDANSSTRPAALPERVTFIWTCRNAAHFQLMSERLQAASRYLTLPEPSNLPTFTSVAPLAGIGCTGDEWHHILTRDCNLRQRLTLPLDWLHVSRSGHKPGRS